MYQQTQETDTQGPEQVTHYDALERAEELDKASGVANRDPGPTQSRGRPMEPRRLTLGLIVGLGLAHYYGALVVQVGLMLLFAVTEAHLPLIISKAILCLFCASDGLCGLAVGAVAQRSTRRGALAGAAVGAVSGAMYLFNGATRPAVGMAAGLYCGGSTLVSCTLGAYLAQLVQQRRQRIPRSATQEGCTADRPPSP